MSTTYEAKNERPALGCGCCGGPDHDQCVCHIHQDISTSVRSKKCSVHKKENIKTATFEELINLCDAAEADWREKCAVIKTFPRDHMGLTPDCVKFSPEYRAAISALDFAFAKMRRINSFTSRTYPKEWRNRQRKHVGAAH